MSLPFDKSWVNLRHYLYSEPLKTLNERILPEISSQPRKEDIFNVFQMPLNKINVVILGQDPYPKPGDATGYAFATKAERKIPRSLQVIAQEIENEGFDIDSENSEWKTLEHWTDQGIFLLNTALTVETARAGSHLKYWNDFIVATIKTIAYKNPCIWILLGKKAQFYTRYITNRFHVRGYDKEKIKDIPADRSKNYIIYAPHPAAETYSGGKAGFYGSDCFYFANRVLKNNKKPEIVW